MSRRLTTPPHRLRRFAGRIVGGYMAFADAATRWQDRGKAHVLPALSGAEPAILAFWHGRILLAHHGWPVRETERACATLISQSKDGDVIATAAESIGLRTIRGSTAKAGKDKGGASALKALVRSLQAGDTVAVTPDGPKGPRMRATMGVIQLAKLSGAPIVPMTWSSGWRWAMHSWDRLAMPFPFGRAIFLWAAPIRVAREADALAMETARRTLEDTLNALTAEADAAMGRPRVEPAPEALPAAAP
jgi:hypothetical protein